MKSKLLQFLIFSFLSSSFVRSASPSYDLLLGVAPEDAKYYSTTSEFIKCKDGSKKIHRNQLNDDFCDCRDGSDEPGTSACPNGRFYCRNAGHMPTILFSSRVNDGICDCCDGSDEYDGKVKCPNTCWESGKAAREKLKKKIATYREGVELQKKEIELAKKAFAKDEAELSKLKDEEKILKDLVQQLKDRKEQIEKLEEKERLEKEKEAKHKEVAQNESNQEEEAEDKAESVKENDGKTTNDVAKDLDDSLHQVDEQVNSKIGHGDDSEMKEESDSNEVEMHVKQEKDSNDEVEVASESATDENAAESENTKGLSKEELGRLVASRWTGEKSDQRTEDDDANEISGTEEPSKNEQDDDYDGYASDFDEPEHKYEPNAEDHMSDANDDDHADSSSYKSDSDTEDEFNSDITASRNPSWLEKIQNTVKSLLHAVNIFQTPLNISDAARVRKEYDESSGKLSKIQSRISSLSDKLKLDFGPEREFYTLHGRCFEAKENKYVYKVCPFKKATQEEGHSLTRLGSWEKFEDSYKVMLFSNGDKCWNGPDRSLKVKLRCGLNNEVADVDEPSRCEYVALLSTPLVCLEQKLKELEQKLEALNLELPSGHDEL